MKKENDMMLELAEQLGLPPGDKGVRAGAADEKMKSAEEKAKKYIDKDDEEILAEIKKLKETIKKDRKTYEKQIALIKGMESMMNGEQKKRLKKILEMLES